jgi:hypothetical protein
MNVQGAFNLLFRAGLRKDFRDNYDAYEVEHTEFLKSGTMDTPEMSATIMTGPSRMVEWGDGAPISYADLKMGPKVMGVDKQFALGIALTRKAVQDDQYGKLKGGAKYLAWAARMTQEYRSAQFLDDAFTGTNFLGIDGLKLCATTHTFLNAAGTWANTPSAPVGLSITGITQLTDLAMIQKDHNGDPMKVSPGKLIIGNSSAQYNKALQIFGSALEPYTAENQDNAIKKRFGGTKVVVSRFMTSTTNYFMVDDRWNDAWFMVRSPVRMEDDFDFNTKAALYSADQRFMIWFVDPRGWYGSNPS